MILLLARDSSRANNNNFVRTGCIPCLYKIIIDNFESFRTHGMILLYARDASRAYEMNYFRISANKIAVAVATFNDSASPIRGIVTAC